MLTGGSDSPPGVAFRSRSYSMAPAKIAHPCSATGGNRYLSSSAGLAPHPRYRAMRSMSMAGSRTRVNSLSHGDYIRKGAPTTNRLNSIAAVSEDEVIEVADYELTSELIDEWREAFWLFDRDGDGTITTKEITAVMRNLGQNPTEDDINEMIKEVDIDGSGSIDFEEFLYMMAKKMRDTDSEEELKSAFRVFDRDNDGRLTVEEMRNVFESIGGKMSKEEIEELLREGDLEGSGFICYDTSFRLWCPSTEKFWESIARDFRQQKRSKAQGNVFSRIAHSISPRRPIRNMGRYVRGVFEKRSEEKKDPPLDLGNVVDMLMHSPPDSPEQLDAS